MPNPKIGECDSELVADFWQAVAVNGRMNLHVLLHYGRNTHHVSEAIFKGLARTLRDAVELDPAARGSFLTKEFALIWRSGLSLAGERSPNVMLED